MANEKATAQDSTTVFYTKQRTSDWQLLNNIASGDRLALRALYARHNMPVYRFVLRLIGDASNAEKIVSDVFFNVWRQAGRFEGRSRVSTWILAIARYNALSIRCRRQKEGLECTAAEYIADQAAAPEQSLDRKDRSRLLRSCLARLSPQHREIIDLVYYHEKSVDEVAMIVGVPPGTVKSRMFYARKSIHDLLLTRANTSLMADFHCIKGAHHASQNQRSSEFPRLDHCIPYQSRLVSGILAEPTCPPSA